MSPRAMRPQAGHRGMVDEGDDGGGGGGGDDFGADVSIEQENAAGDDVRTLHLVNNFTEKAAGAEVSDWTGTVLFGGAEVQAFKFGGQGAVFPAGFFDGFPADLVAGVALGDDQTGFLKVHNPGDGLDYLFAAVEGNIVWTAVYEPTAGSAVVDAPGVFGKATLGGDCFIQRVVSGDGAVANLRLQGEFSGSPTDVVIGPDGTYAISVHGGYLQVPLLDDPPTGDVHLNPGKGAVCLVRTDSGPRWYQNVTGSGGDWGPAS